MQKHGFAYLALPCMGVLPASGSSAGGVGDAESASGAATVDAGGADEAGLATVPAVGDAGGGDGVAAVGGTVGYAVLGEAGGE